jgi:hypothetical protein
MKFALYVLRHPVDGFWELKYQRKGSNKTALILLSLTILMAILDRQLRDFMFNDAYNVPLDIFYQMRIIVFPVLLFCVANWAITTLLDGKGSFAEIFQVTCYSLLPLIIFHILVPALSHFLSLNEVVYVTIVDSVGLFWMCLMVFIGIQVIHEYSTGKMLYTLLLTACSAAILIFILLLFFSLIQEIGSFIYSVYREISLRI